MEEIILLSKLINLLEKLEIKFSIHSSLSYLKILGYSRETLVKLKAFSFPKQCFSSFTTKHGRCFKLGMGNTKASGTGTDVTLFCSSYHYCITRLDKI